jgi:hypothetical protein
MPAAETLRNGCVNHAQAHQANILNTEPSTTTTVEAVAKKTIS